MNSNVHSVDAAVIVLVTPSFLGLRQGIASATFSEKTRSFGFPRRIRYRPQWSPTRRI